MEEYFQNTKTILVKSSKIPQKSEAVLIILTTLNQLFIKRCR